MWANASSFVQDLGILARELLTGSLVGIPSSVISAIAYKVGQGTSLGKVVPGSCMSTGEQIVPSMHTHALREIIPQCPAYLLLFP